MRKHISVNKMFIL